MIQACEVVFVNIFQKNLPKNKYGAWITTARYQVLGYPYQGSSIGYAPVNGHTRHKRQHGKHITLAGTISAKHDRRYVYILPRRNAVSCRRHDAYAYTRKMVRSGQVPLLSTTLIYISNQLHIYSSIVILSCCRRRVGRGTTAFTIRANYQLSNSDGTSSVVWRPRIK